MVTEPDQLGRASQPARVVCTAKSRDRTIGDFLCYMSRGKQEATRGFPAGMPVVLIRSVNRVDVACILYILDLDEPTVIDSR